MFMVVMEGSSLVVILAQWIASKMDLWFDGCVIPTPVHFEDFTSMDEPKIMSGLCGNLCSTCKWGQVVQLHNLVGLYSYV